MSIRHTRISKVVVMGTFVASIFVLQNTSNAAETLGHEPVARTGYALEVEPHLAFSWDNIYGSTGVGGGVRLGVPIVRDGFLTSHSDNLAITLGGDILHYEG